jgi:hypothetical protein
MARDHMTNVPTDFAFPLLNYCMSTKFVASLFNYGRMASTMANKVPNPKRVVVIGAGD